MSEEESAADWAQLVCLTDTETSPFLIAKDKFTIGRARGCDVSHENNKLVSGTHCYLLRDDSGKVWLYDTSTNGTLLNSKIKLSKGECREIEHGDEFYVVHKKGEEHVNIGYVFQDLARLKEEEEEEDDTAEMDQTLEYEDEASAAEATLLDDSINREEEEDEEETSAPVKRRRSSASESQSSLSSKRTKTDRQTDPTSLPAATTATATATAKATSDMTKDKDTEQQPDSKLADKEPEKVGKGGDRKEGGEKGGEEKAGGKKKSDGGGKEAKQGGEEEDAFADTLTCIICQELLYDCVSLQPCMHSFCAGCYSGWMAHSTECPSCRGKVERINKNHIVNNLVEAYLKEHPEKRRPEEDRKDLDAKNKITRDMLYPTRKRASSSEYESSEEEDGDAALPVVVTPFNMGRGALFGFGTPFFGAANNAHRQLCQQCPGSKPSGNTGCAATSCSTTTTSAAAAAAASSASGSSSNNNNNTNNNNNNNDNNNNTAQQPSTSGAGPSGDVDYQERDKKTMPEAPAYTCTADQNHCLCQCCLQIFPDRRTAYHAQPATNRPQQCTVCYRSFCHAYWGCRKADCNGCLAKFADMTFGRKVLTGLILNNGHESDIFSNYLDSKQLAVRDVLAECITKLEGGEYSCPDQVRYNVTGQTPLCFACGLRNFKSLAYQYRAQIPRDELPAEVTARPDCYWGKNCFTQTSKPGHAMRFNHICEQTRR